MTDIGDVSEFMRKSAESIGSRLIAQMRDLAASIDATSGIGNLGNNSVVNALSFALDSLITDMSVYKTDRNADEVFEKIHDEHQHLLHEIIARHSNSKTALLVNTKKEGTP